MIYDKPVPFNRDHAKRRIFSPIAYAHIRNAQVLPVTMHEAGRYTAFYPIVWQQQSEGYSLVIVRSLFGDGRGHLKAAQTAYAFLPLLMRAYPFLPPDERVDPEAAFWIDDSVPDSPTDIGSPICLENGRLARASEQRLEFLDQYRKEAGQTEKFTSALVKSQQLEPWALAFDVEGHRLSVPDLWIIKQAEVTTGAFSELMLEFGVEAAYLLGWHRLSLFRAGQLLARARAALRQPGLSTTPD